MEKWLEPAVQNKTSFEEAGLMRHGVLENMAPLGTLPKGRKATGHGPDGHGSGSSVRRIILRQSVKSSEKPPQEASPSVPQTTKATGSGVGAAPGTGAGKSGGAAAGAGGAATSASAADAAAASVPPPTSPTHTVSTSSRPPRRSLPTQSTAAIEADEDDGDYDPSKLTRRKSLGRPSLPKRGRPPSSARRSSMPSAKTSPVKQRAPTPPSPALHRPDLVEKVIEAAVDEALHHHRYPTAWALRTLYDEKMSDPDFVAMLEEVFTQTASAQTRQEFARQVEEKKREGKRENQGRQYFVPPDDDVDLTPHQPRAAPYGRLLVHHHDHHPDHQRNHHDHHHETAGAGHEDGERRATKKIKISHKRSDSTPRKMLSGATGVVKTPGSRRKARRGSGSSESSLSSLEHLSSPELPAGSELVTSATLASPSLRNATKTKIRMTAKSKSKAKAKATAKTLEAVTTGSDMDIIDPLGRTTATTTGNTSDMGLGMDMDAGAGVGSTDTQGTQARAKAKAKARARAGATGPQSPTQSAPQPITTRRKSLASAKQHRHHQHHQHHQQRPASNASPAAESPSPNSPSPTRGTRHNSHSHAHAHANGSQILADDDIMPGRLASTALDSFSIHDRDTDRDHLKDKSLVSSSSAIKGGPKTQASMPDGRDAAWEKRQEAQKITNGYTAVESSVRHGDEDLGLATPARSTRRTRQSAGVPPPSTRATRSANKRAGDDYSRLASPGVLSVSGQGDGSSAMGSRAVTPTNLRPAKKQKTGLRVKSS